MSAFDFAPTRFHQLLIRAPRISNPRRTGDEDALSRRCNFSNSAFFAFYYVLEHRTSESSPLTYFFRNLSRYRTYRELRFVQKRVKDSSIAVLRIDSRSEIFLLFLLNFCLFVQINIARQSAVTPNQSNSNRIRGPRFADYIFEGYTLTLFVPYVS